MILEVYGLNVMSICIEFYYWRYRYILGIIDPGTSPLFALFTVVSSLYIIGELLKQKSEAINVNVTYHYL